MTLTPLGLAEMIQLSAPWITRGSPAREAIERTAPLAAVLPHLEAAHAAVSAVRSAVGDSERARLSRGEAKLDRRHDRLVRCIDALLTALTALSELTSDVALREEIRLFRPLLLPDGRRQIKKTYRAKAGHAKLVSARLNRTMRARLKRVVLFDRDLLALVQEWLAVAEELGDLVDRSARHRPSPTPSPAICRTRTQWIRAAKLLRSTADWAGVDASTKALILGPLRDAEAARRVPKAKRARKTTEPPTQLERTPAAAEKAVVDSKGAAAGTAESGAATFRAPRG